MLSLLLCLSGSAALGEPSSLQYTPVPLLSAHGERHYRQQLEVCRQARRAMESRIQTLEWLLAANPPRVSAKTLDEIREELNDRRAFAARMKEMERELDLWAQEWTFGPSLETDYEIIERLDKLHQKFWTDRALAPMPREVKP